MLDQTLYLGLKIEDQYEEISQSQQAFDNEQQSIIQNETSLDINEADEKTVSENINQSLSEESLFEVESIEQVVSDNETPLTLEEEYTPKLFSEETTSEENNNSSATEEQKLFDQEKNQEEDFEIPAFLRRQKF